MRILLQRVSRASVRVDGEVVGQVGRGLLALVGFGSGDTVAEADRLAARMLNLRIFSDEQGKMNLCALDVAAELLLVSQFTLYGDCRKGRRPSFDGAAPADAARELYQHFVARVAESGLVTRTGIFQAHMEVELVNDGPITFLLESDK
jgi:D-tyrosyl-tRNA(Tyr) deacylase